MTVVTKAELRAAAEMLRTILARVEAGELTAPKGVVARWMCRDRVGGGGAADAAERSATASLTSSVRLGDRGSVRQRVP